MKIKIFFLIIPALIMTSCLSSPSNIVEIENKGTVMGVAVPDWLKLYLSKGLSALQSLPEYKDVYCIVGEETGVNRQFVLAWADASSAQQRIGSLLRTNIASRYEAFAGSDSSAYRQEINNVLNAIVNVSFSGAQREADWWSLRRRYDPDNKEIFTDEYTAWVFYTVPRTEMNRQIALAMENSVSKDSVLYDLTIALARDILLQGFDETERQTAAAIQKTASDSYDPPGSVVALALDEIDLLDNYFIGRNVAASILSNYQLWNGTPEITDYVNRILQTLVINSPRPSAFNGFSAAILDNDRVNAFATPAGHILITRGLLDAVKSEDALAAVLAHELAHIQLQHGVRAIRENRNIEQWVNQFSSNGAQTIAARLNAGFSHTQEFDADITALSLLAAAGYNPQGLVEVLQELEKIQGSRIGGFNTTHPSPSSRLVNAKVASARYTNLPDNSRFRESRFNEVMKR